MAPNPDSEHTTTDGLSSHSRSKVNPRLSRNPGRMPSTTTSLAATRSANKAVPSSVFKSSTTERLPRLRCRCMSELDRATPLSSVSCTMGQVMART